MARFASVAKQLDAITGAGATLRMVTHGDLDDDAIDLTISALRAALA